MEEEKKEALDETCPRKLDFNAPILSTKQKMSTADSQVASSDACNRIPFSWEKIPGKPKDSMVGGPDDVIDQLPTPKLPPCRWHQSTDVSNLGISTQPYSENYDDGCDADVEDEEDFENDGNEDGISSYTIDVFSLGQSSIDMDETRLEEPRQQQSSGCQSPDFIIKRFLPDARALAASSILTCSKDIDHQNVVLQSSCSSTSICVNKSYPSSKSCGINFLFPWRMNKQKPCGGKNIVQAATSPKTGHISKTHTNASRV